MRFVLIVLAALSLPLSGGAATWQSSAGPVQVTAMATGLDEPWAVGFLPEGGAVITERGGRLWHLSAQGDLSEIAHDLDLRVTGQGGLLDVLVPRDFATSRQLYFTHAKRQGLGSGTALSSARLSPDNSRLTGATVLFEIAKGSRGGRHFGSRIVEAPDGTLFMTVGDRGDRPSAQDRNSHNGAVLRLTRDGTAAQPAAQGLPEIWSFGHRNPQGAALDLAGNLWTVEHGAAGGDEINKIRQGANYGWPLISYGTHYSGAKIGSGTHQPGLEQPEYYWDPSIAPSGMMIYSGALWPEWRGNIFVGSLKDDYIARLGAAPLTEIEQLAGPETGRVRDIREAPDGSIWFLSVHDGALYRISPN